MRTDTHSFRNNVEQHSWGLAPSLRLGIGTDNEFLVSYSHLTYDDIPDFGIPIRGVQNGKSIRVPFNTFYGLADVNYQQDFADIYTARWTHTFDSDTKLTTTLRRNDVSRDLRADAPRVDNAVTTLTRGRQARGADEGNVTADSNLTKKFTTFGMKNEGLAGIEYVHETADRWSYPGTPADPSTTPLDPNPYSTLPGGYASTYAHINPLTYSDTNIGFYAQDIVEFVPHWKLLGGLRYDDFNADYLSVTTSSGAATSYNRSDGVLSYRTGLMYQPTDYVTYYAAYGTAFNPSGDVYSVEATQANRSAKTDPEKSINYEIGAKWELFGGDLSMRTALFRTEKTNERNTDPTSPDIYLLSGRRHTDGIEIEAAGRVTPKWEIFSAIAFMRAEIDKQINPYAVGLTPVNTPAISGNIWSTYKVTDEWKIGGGIDFVGMREGYSIGTTTPYTLPTIRHIPGYARFDAMVQWEQPTYAVKLNMFNLLGQRYYDSIYPNGGWGVPGTDRSAQLSLAYKF